MESPFKPDILEGKVALLTGGGSGIGFEISTQFGKHGASIAIMGRRKSVLDSAVASLRSLGIPAVGFEGDVRKQEDAKRVIESTVKHFGKLDILVNAAAGNFLVSPEDLSPNGFRTVLDIDSVGTFTMCHEALQYLKKGGYGRSSSIGGMILNISATLHYTAYWYQVHVSAAKAAVDSLTRSLALEWGTDYDVRVNGIAPGPISDTTGTMKLVPEEISSKLRDYMPLYKLGEKWDIAMAALYLTSDAEKKKFVIKCTYCWTLRPLLRFCKNHSAYGDVRLEVFLCSGLDLFLSLVNPQLQDYISVIGTVLFKFLAYVLNVR